VNPGKSQTWFEGNETPDDGLPFTVYEQVEPRESRSQKQHHRKQSTEIGKRRKLTVRD
jgi:hypothetical protein